MVIAENHRAKLEAVQSLLSDGTSPLSDIDTGECHFKDISAIEADDPASAMLDVDRKECIEADDRHSPGDQAVTSLDPFFLPPTLTDLEVITEGELLDVSRTEVSDFQLEVDWQRKQRKPELEIVGCALP